MKSPAFQIYPADFLADQNTLVMSAAEIGAYCLLLFVCWRENGLPDDAEELALIARTPLKQFEVSWQKRIARCFQKRDDGMWTHKRLEEERLKQSSNREKRQQAGKQGAGARWQPDSNRIAIASDRQENGIAKNSLSSSDLSLQSSIAGAVAVENSNANGNGNRIDDDARGYPFDHFAVALYEQVVAPEGGLNIRAAEVIAQGVSDSEISRAVWAEITRKWKGNGYRQKNAGTVVQAYEEEMAAIASGKRESPVLKPLTAEEKQRRQEELQRKWEGNHARA